MGRVAVVARQRHETQGWPCGVDARKVFAGEKTGHGLTDLRLGQDLLVSGVGDDQVRCVAETETNLFRLVRGREGWKARVRERSVGPSRWRRCG